MKHLTITLLTLLTSMGVWSEENRIKHYQSLLTECSSSQVAQLPFGDGALFYLNNLKLKKIKLKDSSKVLKKSFDLFIKKYLQNVNWENPKDLEKRVAKLLPVLMLSRIDGKSPVEYITEENEKDEVRLFSRNLIMKPVKSVNQISNKWFR